MNVADIVILAVLALSTLFGLLRGFVSEVVSLASWVGAFWFAWAFGHQVASFYARWLHDPAATIVAGYVTCFVAVLIVGALIGSLLNRLMRAGGLGGGDRFLGMLFGFARGLLLVTFVVLMLGFTAVPRTAGWWRQSTLLPPFENGAAAFAGTLPPAVTHYLEIGGKALPALSRGPISTVPRAAPPVAATAASSAAPVAAGTRTRPDGHNP